MLRDHIDLRGNGMAMNDDERKRLETAVNTANTAYLLVIGLLGELRIQGRTETATNQLARAEECAVAMSMSTNEVHRQDGTRALRELEELRRQIETIKPAKVPTDLETLHYRLNESTATADASYALLLGMVGALAEYGHAPIVERAFGVTEYGVANNVASEDQAIVDDALAYFGRLELLRSEFEGFYINAAFAAAPVEHKTVQ